MMKQSFFKYEGHNYLVPFLIISSLFFMWVTIYFSILPAKK